MTDILKLQYSAEISFRTSLDILMNQESPGPRLPDIHFVWMWSSYKVLLFLQKFPIVSMFDLSTIGVIESRNLFHLPPLVGNIEGNLGRRPWDALNGNDGNDGNGCPLTPGCTWQYNQHRLTSPPRRATFLFSQTTKAKLAKWQNISLFVIFSTSSSSHRQMRCNAIPPKAKKCNAYHVT